MTNPYSSPQLANSDNSTELSLGRKWMIGLTVAVLSIFFLLLCVATVVLVTQAIRFGREGKGSELIWWSWGLSVVTTVFALTIASGIYLAFRNRLLLAWGTLAGCVAIYTIPFIVQFASSFR